MGSAPAKGSVIERAQRDIAEGRLWKARDRLSGRLRTSPGDQKTLRLLGEIYFKMGDLPQEGRHWFLTDRSGPDVEAAFGAFYERFGRAATEVAAALPAVAELDSYPDPVRRRLEELRRERERQNVEWRPTE